MANGVFFWFPMASLLGPRLAGEPCPLVSPARERESMGPRRRVYPHRPRVRNLQMSATPCMPRGHTRRLIHCGPRRRDPDRDPCWTLKLHHHREGGTLKCTQTEQLKGPSLLSLRVSPRVKGPASRKTAPSTNDDSTAHAQLKGPSRVPIPILVVPPLELRVPHINLRVRNLRVPHRSPLQVKGPLTEPASVSGLL